MRPPCGTPAGYKAHRRHSEPVCLRCNDANSDYIRANYIRGGRHDAVRVPVHVLSAMLSSASPEALAVAEAGLGRRTVAALLAQSKTVTS